MKKTRTGEGARQLHRLMCGAAVTLKLADLKQEIFGILTRFIAPQHYARVVRYMRSRSLGPSVSYA